MSISTAETLNTRCWCVGTDLPGLQAQIDTLLLTHGVAASSRVTHPHLFAGVPVFIAEQQVESMRAVVRAVYDVAQLPGWRQAVLEGAGPGSAGGPANTPANGSANVPGNSGAFLGVDFHLDAAGPQLIEVNTNPGGALLNVLLGRAQQACCEPVAAAFPDLHNFDVAEATIMAMLLREWRSGGGTTELPAHVAIVDEHPSTQYLYPEFLLYQQLLRRNGIASSIVAPEALRYVDGRLMAGDAAIDFVYNRLTDFTLEAASLAPLRDAWHAGAIVLTPHPHAHALYADKRNLVRLSDAAWLAAIGVPSATQDVLARFVPATTLVRNADAESLWAMRKQLFFKPLRGFGSRGTYRGDKLTRAVFAEIVNGDYVAQALVTPSERCIGDEVARSLGKAQLKVDVRAYAYEGEVLLLAARLYRGQTTNFRTEGGGFAPVLRAYEGCGCAVA